MVMLAWVWDGTGPKQQALSCGFTVRRLREDEEGEEVQVIIQALITFPTPASSVHVESKTRSSVNKNVPAD
ncbi:hypothetical protein C0J45_17954 [Silurus meridionalis]|nr:hypothetical protein C0J45_17954 [Silurus meridionalis]